MNENKNYQRGSTSFRCSFTNKAKKACDKQKEKNKIFNHQGSFFLRKRNQVRSKSM